MESCLWTQETYFSCTALGDASGCFLPFLTPESDIGIAAAIHGLGSNEV
jgi:hypothetical protein